MHSTFQRQAMLIVGCRFQFSYPLFSSGILCCGHNASEWVQGHCIHSEAGLTGHSPHGRSLTARLWCMGCAFRVPAAGHVDLLLLGVITDVASHSSGSMFLGFVFAALCKCIGLHHTTPRAAVLIGLLLGTIPLGRCKGIASTFSDRPYRT